jgi:hypothetical protein
MSKRKFEDGEKVTITDKFPQYIMKSWGLKEGDAVQIAGISYDGHYNVRQLNGGSSTRVPIAALCKFVGGGKRTQLLEYIKKAEEKIEQTKAFIKETKAKIAFMDETGSDTYNENEFKAYQTLTIIEKGDLSKMDKAKAIAALLDKKD